MENQIKSKKVKKVVTLRNLPLSSHKQMVELFEKDTDTIGLQLTQNKAGKCYSIW